MLSNSSGQGSIKLSFLSNFSGQAYRIVKSTISMGNSSQTNTNIVKIAANAVLWSFGNDIQSLLCVLMIIFRVKRIMSNMTTIYIMNIMRYGRSPVRLFTLEIKVYPVTTFPTPQAMSVKAYMLWIVKICVVKSAMVYTIIKTNM